jgi:hypothetical protein
MHAGFGVVAVHVENRRLNHLGDVGWIGRETALPGQRGEADLVVDDDVNRAAGAVIREVRTEPRVSWTIPWPQKAASP